MWTRQEHKPKDAHRRLKAPVGEGIVLHPGPCNSVELGSALHWPPGELLARLQTFQPRRAGLPSQALGELQGLLTHPPLV